MRMLECSLQGFILALSFSFDTTKVRTFFDLAKGKFLLTKKKCQVLRNMQSTCVTNHQLIISAFRLQSSRKWYRKSKEIRINVRELTSLFNSNIRNPLFFSSVALK